MRRSAKVLTGLLLTAGMTAACDDNGLTDPDPTEPGFGTISANITTSRTLYADTVYTISGFIQVINGATLTIEPGTIIQGDYNVIGSSLFITRGARIIANGTAQDPIVFTSSQPVGQRRTGDWGGLILIGNGIINRASPANIEGTGTDAVLNPFQNYAGGTNNADNSGILRYVRIEYAGFPTAPDQELNSLTMAAVGSGTTIEYVQVLMGLDDSFEWFGGAVDAKYIISYEAGDDHLDMSEGYVGRVQYAIGFQSHQQDPRPGLSGGVATDPQGIENDGCWAGTCNGGSNNTNAQPYTIPVIANFTLVGAPQGAWETPSGNIGMMLRRGTGGLYVNGVVARYSRAGISIRGENTNARATEGNLAVRNIHLTEIANNAYFQPGSGTGEAAQYSLDLTANNITTGTASATSLFVSLPTPTGATTAANFNWRPAPGSPIATGGLTSFTSLSAALQARAQGFITPTSYRGAADPNGALWWEGWTNYARN